MKILLTANSSHFPSTASYINTPVRPPFRSRVTGEDLKLRCEVRGSPPVTEFRWFHNNEPLRREKGRVKVRSRVGEEEFSWSQGRTEEGGGWKAQRDEKT